MEKKPWRPTWRHGAIAAGALVLLFFIFYIALDLSGQPPQGFEANGLDARDYLRASRAVFSGQSPYVQGNWPDRETLHLNTFLHW